MTNARKIGMALGGAVAAVAVTVLMMGVVEAQQPAGRGYMAGGQGIKARPGGRGLMALGFGLRQLDLTEQQRQQIKGILQGHREKAQALAAQGRAAGRALRQAIADGADEPTIRAKAADAAKVQADAAVLRAQVRNEIVAVLTPEQQAKAKALREKARGWRRSGLSPSSRPTR